MALNWWSDGEKSILLDSGFVSDRICTNRLPSPILDNITHETGRERIFAGATHSMHPYPGVIAGTHGAPVVGVVALRGWTIVE